MLDQLAGGVLIGKAAFDHTFLHPQNRYLLVNGSTKARLAAALSAYPEAKVFTRDEFVTNRSAFISKLLNMVYVLLALSVIVSLFGMVNTLVLSVFERTREFGMLRAVGMTRRQTRRMVRHESIITALIGAAIGLPLGLGLAWVVIQRLSSVGVHYQLPVTTLVVFVGVAAIAGIGAALLPARRASRLNVLTHSNTNDLPQRATRYRYAGAGPHVASRDCRSSARFVSSVESASGRALMCRPGRERAQDQCDAREECRFESREWGEVACGLVDGVHGRRPEADGDVREHPVERGMYGTESVRAGGGGRARSRGSLAVHGRSRNGPNGSRKWAERIMPRTCPAVSVGRHDGVVSLRRVGTLTRRKLAA